MTAEQPVESRQDDGRVDDVDSDPACPPEAGASSAGEESDRVVERPLDRRLRQRHPWRELPAIVVLVIAAAGLGYVLVIPQHWLRGVLLFAGAMGLGGVLRLILPSRYAGLLSIRNRWFDAFCFIVLAAAMAVLGLWLRRIGAT